MESENLSCIIFNSHDDFETGTCITAEFTEEGLLLRQDDWNYNFPEREKHRGVLFDRDATWILARKLGCRLIEVPRELARRFGSEDEFSDVGKYAFYNILDYARCHGIVYKKE